MADQAHARRAERLQRFCSTVQGTAPHARSKSVGRIRSHALDGQPNQPYYHQLRASSLMFSNPWALLAHDPGLGKTTTALLTEAGIACRDGDALKTLVTAPLSTLEQWYETAQNWLKPEFAAKVHIVRTQSDVTAERLDRPQLIICTHELLVQARASCFYWEYEDRFDERFQRFVGGWRRRPKVPLHPIFVAAFDLFVIDEVHRMRNPKSQLTLAHALVAKNARHRLGLTGTPVFNHPIDMVGQAMALNAGTHFQDVENWSSDPQRRTINRATSERWNRNVHRATDADLTPPLPPLVEEYVSFAPGSIDHERYNEYLETADEARQRQQDGHARSDDHFQMLVALQKMQQALISPDLADRGARAFAESPGSLEAAVKLDLPCLKVLRQQVQELQTSGIHRVVVACDRVLPLKIAQAMLRPSGVGDVFLFDGSLSPAARRTMRRKFMGARKAVMLLSIQAGGTGTHLAPGVNGMILWGARPFSAQQVRQAVKRVHRIGQTAAVQVRHIVADGSVDAAIVEMHKSKIALAEAVVDGMWDNLADGEADKKNEYRWHTYTRLMNYVAPAQSDGTFALAARSSAAAS